MRNFVISRNKKQNNLNKQCHLEENKFLVSYNFFRYINFKLVRLILWHDTDEFDFTFNLPQILSEILITHKIMKNFRGTMNPFILFIVE